MTKTLEYYECLIDFLDDHIPNIQDVIEQFDECWEAWEIEEDEQ